MRFSFLPHPQNAEKARQPPALVSWAARRQRMGPGRGRSVSRFKVNTFVEAPSSAASGSYQLRTASKRECLVFPPLKDEFTQKWEFSHYLLTPVPMGSQVKFRSPRKNSRPQHCPKHLKQLGTCWIFILDPCRLFFTHFWWTFPVFRCFVSWQVLWPEIVEGILWQRALVGIYLGLWRKS